MERNIKERVSQYVDENKVKEKLTQFFQEKIVILKIADDTEIKSDGYEKKHLSKAIFLFQI